MARVRGLSMRWRAESSRQPSAFLPRVVASPDLVATCCRDGQSDMAPTSSARPDGTLRPLGAFNQRQAHGLVHLLGVAGARIAAHPLRRRPMERHAVAVVRRRRARARPAAQARGRLCRRRAPRRDPVVVRERQAAGGVSSTTGTLVKASAWSVAGVPLGEAAARALRRETPKPTSGTRRSRHRERASAALRRGGHPAAQRERQRDPPADLAQAADVSRLTPSTYTGEERSPCPQDKRRELLQAAAALAAGGAAVAR